MTTNSTVQTPPTSPLRRWIPRTLTAYAILLLGFLVVAIPAVLTIGLAWLSYPGCFDTCGDPVVSGLEALSGLAVALTPVVAVRVYQGEWTSSAPARLLVAAGVVIVPAALAGMRWAHAAGW